MGYRDITSDVFYIYGVVLDLDEFLHFLMIYETDPELLKIKDDINKYISIKQKERDIEENDELTDVSEDECEEEYHSKGNDKLRDNDDKIDIDKLKNTIYDTLHYIGVIYGTRYTINNEQIYVYQMPHDSDYSGKIALGICLKFNSMIVKIYDSTLDMFGNYEKHDMSFLSQFTSKRPKLIVTRDSCLCCT
jgi:hypothetical protein